MSILDAVVAAGQLPLSTAPREVKKAYSERLSNLLAIEVADGLRLVGFPDVKPARDGPHEKQFQGGLGPKKVDVSYSDEQHGLLLAVSVKTINAAPFGKNLPNRFSDLCTEAITLHMRFPYSVICALVAFPATADQDNTPLRTNSTFRRATRLFGSISGRREYTDPGEKFEHFALMLYQPSGDAALPANIRLVDAVTEKDMIEQNYFLHLRHLFNQRNPHATIADLDADE